MTTDEIETAAIEAALRKFSVGVLVAMGERLEAANARFEKELHTSDPETAAQLAELRGITVEAIRAYGHTMIQPGETAPKDGKPFLAWIKNGIPFVVQFHRETPLGGAEFIDPCGLLRTELYSRDIHAWQPLPRREGE